MSGVRYPVRKTGLVLHQLTACREKICKGLGIFSTTSHLKQNKLEKEKQPITHLSYKYIKTISKGEIFYHHQHLHTTPCKHSLWRKWYKPTQRQNWEGIKAAEAYIYWYGIHFFH